MSVNAVHFVLDHGCSSKERTNLSLTPEIQEWKKRKRKWTSTKEEEEKKCFCVRKYFVRRVVAV